MTFDLIIEINHSPLYVREYRVVGTYREKMADASYSHEFGVEVIMHREITDIYLDNVYIIDEEGEQVEIVPDKHLESELNEKLVKLLL